jgi:hypothetical protein
VFPAAYLTAAVTYEADLRRLAPCVAGYRDYVAQRSAPAADAA